MKKVSLGVWLVLVAVLALGASDALAQVKATGVTKVITLAGGDINPPVVEINRGDTVIWTAIDQPAMVYFSEGTPV